MSEDTGLDLDAVEARMARRYVFTASDGLPAIDGGAGQQRDLEALVAELRAAREQVAEMVRQRDMALTKVGEAWRRVGAAEEQVANPRQDAGMAELWAKVLTEREEFREQVATLTEALVALREDQVAWSNRDYIIRQALLASHGEGTGSVCRTCGEPNAEHGLPS